MTGGIKHVDKGSEPFDLIVIGGGLSGLVAAALAKKYNPRSSIMVVERDPVPGGSLRGVDELGQHFELGTHILQETGNSDVDKILTSCVDDESLVSMESSVGDWVATVRNGTIYDSVGYPAVIEFDQELAQQILAEILLLVKKGKHSGESVSTLRSLPCQEATSLWLGKTAWEEVVEPYLRSKYGSTEELTGFALELSNMSRIHVATEQQWRVHSEVASFRSRVAYPNQTLLPNQFRHGRRSLYSRRRGLIDFVDGLILKCELGGVLIKTNCVTQAINSDLGEVQLSQGDQELRFRYRNLLSCIGPSATREIVEGRRLSRSNRIPLRLLHMKLTDALNTPVCYFYDHDVGSKIFRITNYSAFSGVKDDARLTVEVFGCSDMNDKELFAYVMNSPTMRAILGVKSQPKEFACTKTFGFALPSKATFRQFETDSELLLSSLPDSTKVCGVGTTGTHYFQTEILKDVASSIERIFS